VVDTVSLLERPEEVVVLTAECIQKVTRGPYSRVINERVVGGGGREQGAVKKWGKPRNVTNKNSSGESLSKNLQ
jgi:hypothetical protein